MKHHSPDPRAERWIIRPRGVQPAPGATRLICFPHAGGGASVYLPWGAQLPELDVMALQLPGRESRLSEPALDHFPSLREAVVQALAPLLDRPFVFFGHSMGALLAYEAARALQLRGGPLPVHLYVSGRRCPLVRDSEPPLHGLPDLAFLDALDKRFGGVPAVIRNDPDLRALFVPTLRADLGALERHRFEPDALLRVPITALGGVDDPQTTSAMLAGWSELTSRAFDIQRFEGGHFYLHERRAEFLPALRALFASRGWHDRGARDCDE